MVPALVALVLWAAPTDALQITGLEQPESFVATASGDGYFISNVNGEPHVKDNNGFITKLRPDGTVLQLRFIEGGRREVVLHAPKGMAIVDRTLYVADIDVLRGFETESGRPTVTVPVTRSGNASRPALADVASDGGNLLYVSDTANDAIYQVDRQQQHAVSVLIRDQRLAGPSGLAVHPKTGHLIVVSWEKGKILEVSQNGELTELVSNGFFSARFAHLSGVEFDSWGNMYISDLSAGKIWRMRPSARFDVIAEFLPAPADIGIDRQKHLILVPYRLGNAAEMNGLEAPADPNRKKARRTLKDYGFGGMKDPEGR